jgi:hypothetical protein
VALQLVLALALVAAPPGSASERVRVEPATGGARYAVRESPDGRRVVVRVYRGYVRVSTVERSLAVGGGRQTSVICRRDRPCTLSPQRWFDPDEPWFGPVEGALRPPARRFTVRAGSLPASSRLAPRGADTWAYPLAAPGRRPAAIVVAWTRPLRTTYGDMWHAGAMLWRREPGRRVDRWSLARSWLVLAGSPPGIQRADLTGDGVPEALIQVSLGTSMCGPRRVVGAHGVLLAGGGCETSWRLEPRKLVVWTAIGPCPHTPASVHCAGGGRTTVYRWNGKRLARTSVAVRCNEPHLDPARECRPRK